MSTIEINKDTELAEKLLALGSIEYQLILLTEAKQNILSDIAKLEEDKLNKDKEDE